MAPPTTAGVTRPVKARQPAGIGSPRAERLLIELRCRQVRAFTAQPRGFVVLFAALTPPLPEFVGCRLRLLRVVGYVGGVTRLARGTRPTIAQETAMTTLTKHFFALKVALA